MKRFIVLFLMLTGCAARVQIQNNQTAIPPVPLVTNPSHPWHEMIIYVPQTEEAAAAALKWFAKYPELRMVVAMSPRFQNVLKEGHLKDQFTSLLKEKRLELGLQIPNAPLLPLLMNTSSAKDTLPPDAELPAPAYAYPDDVIQLVAQSKAGFYKQWNFLPHGLILPFGAASPPLLSLLDRLGFSWVIGSIEAPIVDGAYQFGSFMFWDAAPSGKPIGTVVHVWDERQVKAPGIDAWVKETKEKEGVFLLPSDERITIEPLKGGVGWKERTWSDPNWRVWIGDSAKNSAWTSLRKTREALENFKNSGRASVSRLDVAFEEMYTAQNSNYFSTPGNTSLSPATVEDRAHDFQATLSAVYRLIGQQPPEDLFQSTTEGLQTSMHLSSTTTKMEILPDGREHVQIDDAVGDAMGGPAMPDLQSLDVWASTSAVDWRVTLATMVPASIDIYVDINGQPNAGTTTFLPGRDYGTSPIDAWEYAIAIAGTMATLYRTHGVGAYGAVQTYPVIVEGNSLHVTIPREMMRGSPKRWGYQVLALHGNVITDMIDPVEISQKELWADLTSGKRSDIPFIRIRAK